MGQQEVDLEGDIAPEGTLTVAQLEPVDPDTYSGADPVVGVGAVNSTGLDDTTLDLGPYVGDDQWETANQVMVVDLYAVAPDGTWQLSSVIPYPLQSTSEDPVLQQDQLTDPTDGEAVPNQAVAIEAIPTDPDSWPSGDPYPTLGWGSTDSDGYVDATLTVSPATLGSDFLDSSNTAEIGAYYTDGAGDSELGDTAYEHFTPDGDLIALPSPVLDADGDPAPYAEVVLEAEPLSDSGGFNPSDGTRLATAESNDSGYVDAGLDLADVQGNPDYVSPGGVAQVAVFTTEGGGTLTYQYTVAEEVDQTAEDGEIPMSRDDAVSMFDAAGCGDLPVINDGPGDWALAPPEGFDPLTAPDAVMTCLGLPARPSDPADEAEWQSDMSDLGQFVPPEDGEYTDPPMGLHDTNYQVWAGMEAIASQNNRRKWTFPQTSARCSCSRG